MKKIPAIILSIVFISNIFCVFAVANDTTNLIYSDISETEVGLDDTISVPIKISDNEGFMGFCIVIDYDDTEVEPLSITGGDITDGGVLNDSIGYLTSGQTKVVYYCSDGDITNNGTLFTINMKILDSELECLNLSISYQQADTFNENWDDVVFNCQNISVNLIRNNTACFALEDTSIYEDDFSVPILAKNFSSITQFNISIKYDESLIEYTDMSLNECVENATISTTNGNITISYTGNALSFEECVLGYINLKKAASFENAEIEVSCSLLKSNDNTINDVLCVNSILSAVPADELPTKIYCDDVIAFNDEIVELPVYIKNNHGIMGFRLNFEYDNSTFTPIDVISSGLNVGSVENNIGTGNEKVSVLWSNTENFSDNGELFIVRFKINDSVSSAETQISVDYSQEDTYNENWDDVALSCESATITVVSNNTITSKSDTNAQINNHLIYGLTLGDSNIEDYISINDAYTIEYDDSTIFYTNKPINILYNDSVVDEYFIVIFGDVNGDGIYDGTDSIIVNCIANGMLTREQVGEAVWLASDCNHDGVIDSVDVSILEQAGLILAQVDQTMPTEELESDSTYQEYLNLIDQSPAVEEETENTPTEEPAQEELTESFLTTVISVLMKILNYIINIINKII